MIGCGSPRAVDQDEIAALYGHFQKISSTKSDDGLIDKEEFQLALGLKDGLFVDRIFGLFDENGDGVINFREFLVGLSVFCTKGTFDQKLQCTSWLGLTVAAGIGEIERGGGNWNCSHVACVGCGVVSFNMYDIDRDGYIDKAELYQMLKASLMERHLDLPESQMRALVERTFTEADGNGDGRISLEEYKEMVRKHPTILSNMTINTATLFASGDKATDE